jgi:hypothetical protein
MEYLFQMRYLAIALAERRVTLLYINLEFNCCCWRGVVVFSISTTFIPSPLHTTPPVFSTHYFRTLNPHVFVCSI